MPGLLIPQVRSPRYLKNLDQVSAVGPSDVHDDSNVLSSIT
jgi:hypothetical protein